MWHPVHLHGHTFAIGDDRPRKDTAIVLPGKTRYCGFRSLPAGVTEAPAMTAA